LHRCLVVPEQLRLADAGHDIGWRRRGLLGRNSQSAFVSGHFGELPVRIDDEFACDAGVE
jgi:hypothetical protein